MKESPLQIAINKIKALCTTCENVTQDDKIPAQECIKIMEEMEIEILNENNRR